jgi:mRNA (guanine-N7-)-methyltransferase
MNRNNSYFINMRKFHNSIKKELYNKYANGVSNLLEIAVGKGGDLSKWNGNNIKHIVGYDIDNDSITEAKRRVKEYNSDKKDIEIELYTLDLSNNEIPKAKEKFDVVSAQFSFHYFFKSKETFETVMKSINNNIRRGGYFIGTIFDGESIRKIGNVELKDNGQLKFKLSNISSLNETEFGNEVTVQINDTVLSIPTTEYIVDFQMFKKLMKEHGYDLIESNMFKTINNPFILKDIEKSVSFLNRTFVFKRTFCEDRIDNILSWCPLKEDILKYNEKLLYKYKKELFEKFKVSKNEKYLFIIKNFENIPNLKDHSDFV